MWEIASREYPFVSMERWQVGEAIVRGERPPVDAHVWPQDYCAVMEKCWAQEPASRPTFKEAVEALDQAMSM